MAYIDFIISASIFLVFIFISLIFIFSKLNFNLETNFDKYYKIGEIENEIISKSYLIPIVLIENLGANKEGTTKIKIDFDKECKLIAKKSSIALLDENYSLVKFNLVNITFCSFDYVKSAELIFNFSISANTNKTYYIFFSPDFDLNLTYYNFPSTYSSINYSVYPKVEIKVVSEVKAKSLNQSTSQKIFSVCFPYYFFRDSLKIEKFCYYLED